MGVKTVGAKEQFVDAPPEMGPANLMTLAAAQRFLRILPPGRFLATGIGIQHWQTPPEPTSEMGIELAFTDNAGAHWLRTADFDLKPLDESPYAHYKASRQQAAYRGLDLKPDTEVQT